MASVLDYFRGTRSSYQPIPTGDAPPPAPPGEPPNETQALTRHERARNALKLTAATLVLALAGYLALALAVRRSASRQCDTVDRGYQCDTATSHYWGQYSPYFSVPSEIDAAIPQGCEVTFAQVLSRHGARAPTRHRAEFYAEVIDSIHRDATSYAPGYEFLETYAYALGADQLTAMGRQQMFNSGLKFYRRYRALARREAPFVRASGQRRVVDSAHNFSSGFHAAALADPEATTAPHDGFPYDTVVIPETPTANNTLHHGLCTAFETGPYALLGDAAQATYLATFAPAITARLNAALPGANLSDAAAVALMDLCPFETVALPPSSSSSSGLTLSPFCHLFPAADWHRYDYYQSLGKWYGYGPGNPLGPTQGVGFVNELLARLRGRGPVHDGTSSNRTLDGNNATFPLGRALYADFSHDNDIMGVLGALRLYEDVEGMGNTTRTVPEDQKNGGYAASWAVPFAARMYVEKMRCEDRGKEEMVRVLVNDRVMSLKGCGADERGMCTLDRFVESMAFARGGGKWDECFD
jgi:hypothetical protein